MDERQASYQIFADSACDIAPDLLQRWNIQTTGLECTCDSPASLALDTPEGMSAFYQLMREGATFKTAAVSPWQFATAFQQTLDAGRDVFYIGFSSGLSGMFDNAFEAASELRRRNPERTVHVTDSLCASTGYGLLLHLAAAKRDAGASLEELVAYVEDIKLRICHLFTVDDLAYLKRGGRVSPAAANVAAILDIKPIMHMDEQGKLTAIGKVRGRHKALADLITRYGKTAAHPLEGPVYLTQSDCMEDARTLARMMQDAYGVEVELIGTIGPVIGAHSGPGTLALFFEGVR